VQQLALLVVVVLLLLLLLLLLHLSLFFQLCRLAPLGHKKPKHFFTYY
jgi:hypothetical protein